MGNKYSAILIILLYSLSLFGQNISLEGIIFDTLHNPLEFANVLAIPHSQEQSIAFSISDEKGRYKLSLQKDITYRIEISFLGFEKAVDSLLAKEDALKDFMLFPGSKSLKEITITEKHLPIIVKEDTIIYRTSAFASGKERKLREVLKKLPGVEVDQEGGVVVNGKKVDKLLVEGKSFFSGDTKLGVNNIPADAVDAVEVLGNYTEIPFLKGLRDEDKMAMNIKLKEEKKKFVFGDVDAGAGIKSRYIVHPSLFYYSPNTNINAIGDWNNIGKKSFTFNDYLNFEGGIAKFINNPVNYFNLANNEFAKFLINNDLIASKDQFGAFNIARQFSSKMKVNAYAIFNAGTMETKIENDFSYVLNDQVINRERRNNTTKTESIFSLHKMEVAYIRNTKEDLRFSTTLKTSDGNSNATQESLSTFSNNSIKNLSEPNSWEINQDIEYSRQFSKNHTTTFKTDFRISRNNDARTLSLTEPIFSELIPLNGTAPLDILQDMESKNYGLSIGLKHYWAINDFNHIYPVLSYNFSSQQFFSSDYQLYEEQKLSFDGAGFNNSTILKLSNPYAGFNYKAKAGDFTFKTGIVCHRYFWNINQIDEIQTKKSKFQILPELSVKWDIKNSEKLDLTYRLGSQFNDVSYFANRLRLDNFNSLYRGNLQLENATTHDASIYYSRFISLRGLSYNARVNYSQKEKSIQNAIEVDGINQVNFPLYTDFPDKNLRLASSFSKAFNKYKFSINGNASISDYFRRVNEDKINYKSQNFGYKFKLEANFEKYPNLEIGITQNYHKFRSGSYQSNFFRSEPFIIIQSSFLKNFNLKGDYRRTFFKNVKENAKNVFEIFNGSLYYHKEDSPWGFEIEIDNLLNAKYKNQNSFNQFVVSDTRIFIQSRIMIVKVTYKL